MAAATIKAGDVFTIDNVYAVNPVSKQSTGRLQQFVVTTLSTLSGGGGTVTVSPNIVTTGPYQNVDAAPIDGAGLNFVGAASSTYAQNMFTAGGRLCVATAGSHEHRQYHKQGKQGKACLHFHSGR